MRLLVPHVCIHILICSHTQVFYLSFHEHVVIDRLFSSSSMKSASDSCSFAYTIHEEKWNHFKKASAHHSGVCYAILLIPDLEYLIFVQGFLR